MLQDRFVKVDAYDTKKRCRITCVHNVHNEEQAQWLCRDQRLIVLLPLFVSHRSAAAQYYTTLTTVCTGVSFNLFVYEGTFPRYL